MPTFRYAGRRTLPNGTVAVTLPGHVFDVAGAGAVRCRPKRAGEPGRPSAADPLDLPRAESAGERGGVHATACGSPVTLTVSAEGFAAAAFREARGIEGERLWLEVGKP